MSNEHTYTVEKIKVGELQVDPRVQRDSLQTKKVDTIVKKFNFDAVGVIHVSRRKDRGLYIIDGWHRTEAVRRVTDATGEMVAHVYEGLTLAEEALMFLDLNYANQPSPLEKHKARVVAEDEMAMRVEEAVHKYGWVISSVPNNGNVQAIQRLYAIDTLSQKINADPDLVSVVFMVITRAWGIDRYGSQSVIMDGIARLVAEYGSKVDLVRLHERLKEYPGGPRGLHSAATDLAALRKGRVSLAVAELMVDWYNKGYSRDSKKALSAWRQRRG
jgi:hypothetical protein